MNHRDQRVDSGEVATISFGEMVVQRKRAAKKQKVVPILLWCDLLSVAA